jgi:hypothetical protein
MLRRYKSRVPIICQKSITSRLPDHNKQLVVPTTVTADEFLGVVRKRLKLEEGTANFQRLRLLVDGNIELRGSNSMLEIYKSYRSEDFYLYVTYTEEIIDKKSWYEFVKEASSARKSLINLDEMN